MKLALIEFHLNVAATSIELSFSVLHTAHLSSVLAPAQAGLCIDTYQCSTLVFELEPYLFVLKLAPFGVSSVFFSGDPPGFYGACGWVQKLHWDLLM